MILQAPDAAPGEMGTAGVERPRSKLHQHIKYVAADDADVTNKGKTGKQKQAKVAKILADTVWIFYRRPRRKQRFCSTKLKTFVIFVNSC